MDVRLPDGTIIQNVPDGTTKADLVAKLKTNGMAVPSDWLQTAPEQPAAVSAGKSINSGIGDIPRQLGLTARYAIEGPAQAAQIVTEPIANLMRAAGIKTDSLGNTAAKFANWLGLPEPQGANERVIGDAARLMAGSGATMGLGGAASALPGMAGKIGAAMAANPGQQLASSAGAGLAGGASREAGGGELMQAGAGILGGVAGGLAGGLASGAVRGAESIANKVKNFSMSPQQMDAKISAVLNRVDFDYGQIPEQAKAALRAELGNALKAGEELKPDAVRRLAEFRALGVTPTRGMVTQDPVQITREMNLAKMAANAGDEELHGLPRIQNQNNSTLINVLNQAGAQNGDLYRAGQRSIGAINAVDQGLNSRVSSLYQQARDTSGRSAQLDGPAFTQKASQMLDEALLGGALPKDVENHLNKIALGEVPFDVNYAEQLKTRIGNLQRATNDGSTRMALGMVRRALDETQLRPSKMINPENLPAVPGTVPPSMATLGQESIDAFNQARQAARARFAWQESGKPIAAALDGAQPDDFINQFVIRGSVADAKSLAQHAPREEVRDAILAHLKDKALSSASDEVGKFSQSAFNKAMKQIGDRKLELFFTPEELGRLKMTGRVAAYTQNQPVGSAVNNSNSGALLLGRGADILKKIPLIGPNVAPALRSLDISIQNNRAQNVIPGLLVDPEKVNLGGKLLSPGVALGGLLSAPVVNQP